MKRNLKSLADYSLGGTDGQIGKVSEVYFDEVSWQVQYWVVDTGHWLPGRKVLIDTQGIIGLDWKNRTLQTSLTLEEINDSPDISADKPVSIQEESRSFGHQSNYWFLPEVKSISPPSTNSATNPHLRSSQAVIGYQAQAADGHLGRVTDFVLDTQGWQITYMVIDTGSWLSINEIMLPVDLVRRIDWQSSSVAVIVSKKSCEQLPSYDPGEGVNVLSDGGRLDYDGRIVG